MRPIVSLLILLLVGACSPGPIKYVYPTDENPSLSGQKVYILPFIENPGLRQDIRKVFDTKLKGEINYSWSMVELEDDDLLDFESVEEFRENELLNFPWLLTISIIKSEKEPNAKQHRPEQFKYQLLYYANNIIPEVYETGYVHNKSKYYFEANLYNDKGENLVWNGRSQLFRPVEIQTVLVKFGNSLIREVSR